MIGSDAVVEMLIRHGVKDVFGVPGDTSMNFHDAFARNNKINYIICRDERNASYMADAYARVKGGPGVVEVPSGGGALYAVPGVSEANESFIPLICLSSDITMSSDDTGALTDVSQEYLYKPVTKWNCKIRQAEKIPQLMRKAFRMATGGRPGAVHISIPENIHGQEVSFAPGDLSGADFACALGTTRNRPVPEDLEAIRSMISKANRPVVIAGGGIHLSAAWKEIEEFAGRFDVPVATSVNGKGSIREFSPFAVGVIGANGGSEETNSVIKEADLVLVLGSKLNNVTTMGREIFNNKPIIIQVDVREDHLDNLVRISLPVISDIRWFLKDLTSVLAPQERELRTRFEAWNRRVREIISAKRERIAKEARRNGKFVNPARLFLMLEEMSGEDTIFVADAGTPTPYLSSHLRLKKAGRQSILPRSHGSLGYALPAAIGAKVASPQSAVISLFGDGSFGMAVGDLETAKRIGQPVIFINLHNDSYGWIKTIQKLYYEERYFAVDFSSIDAGAIAGGFGLPWRKIASNAELEEGLQWAFAQKTPVFLNIIIDPPTEVIPPVVKWLRDESTPAGQRKKLTY